MADPVTVPIRRGEVGPKGKGKPANEQPANELSSEGKGGNDKSKGKDKGKEDGKGKDPSFVRDMGGGLYLREDSSLYAAVVNDRWFLRATSFWDGRGPWPKGKGKGKAKVGQGMDLTGTRVHRGGAA